MVHLMLIDRDDEDTLGFDQALCVLQPLLHEPKPLAVSPNVIVIDVSIVLLPIARTRVVRRIDVDAVNLTFVEIDEELQGVEVFSVDDGVVWLVIGTAADGSKRREGRKY